MHDGGSKRLVRHANQTNAKSRVSRLCTGSNRCLVCSGFTFFFFYFESRDDVYSGCGTTAITAVWVLGLRYVGRLIGVRHTKGKKLQDKRVRGWVNSFCSSLLYRFG